MLYTCGKSTESGYACYKDGEFLWYFKGKPSKMEAVWGIVVWYKEVEPRHHQEIANMYYENSSLRCEFKSGASPWWTRVNPTFRLDCDYRLLDSKGKIIKESPAKLD